MQPIAALISICILSASSAFAQGHDVYYQGDLTPLNTTPTFEHGYLAVYDWKNKVDLFSPDGTFLYSAAANVPDADWASILNAGIDSDGTMALAVRAAVNPGFMRGGGIALFDRSGRQLRYFDTGDYFPTQVAFAPDHAIWTIGHLGETVAGSTRDYMILRHYSLDGQELGAFLPRSTFPVDEYAGTPQPVVMPMLGLWELRVVNDAVDVIFHQAHLWVQTDARGKENGRWKTVPPVYRPSAITSDGKAWAKEGNQLKWFDRSLGVWKAVAFNVPNGSLIGADADSLVFLLSDKRTLRRVPAPGVPDVTARQR